MKILMTRAVQGSLDGVTVIELKAGNVYDTVDGPRGDRLARYHIKQGVATVPVEPRAASAGPVVLKPAVAKSKK